MSTAHDYDQRRRSWVGQKTKETAEWGEKQAANLWKGLYARWEPVIDGRVVLDLGCSWGYLLRHVLERHRPRGLVGVDVRAFWDEEPLRWDYRQHGDLVQFHKGDLLSAGLEDESLDLILCTSVFQYLPPEVLDATLTRALRLLRPGGELMGRTQVYTSYLGASLHRDYELPYAHFFHGERQLKDRVERAGRHRSYTNWLTASSYLLAMARAGFEIVDSKRTRNRFSAAHEQRIYDEFPATRNELDCSNLEFRLLKPFSAADLRRVEEQTRPTPPPTA